MTTVTVEQLGYGVAAFLVLSKLYVYRKIRPFKILLLVAFLVYRFRTATESTENLLSLFQALLSQTYKLVCAKLGNSGNNTGFLLVVNDLMAFILISELINFVHDMTNWNLKGLFKALTDYFFNMVKDISFVKATLSKEQSKLEESFDKDLKIKSRAVGNINTELPDKGITQKEILDILESSTKREDTVWEKGHLSGSVYNGQRGHIEFLNKCYSYYSIANPLHPDIWPTVMKFESEIIAMTAALVNGGHESVCGATSSVSFLYSILARPSYSFQFYLCL